MNQTKRHETTVHAKFLPFRCNICPKGFHNPANLKRHSSLAHLSVKQGFVKCPHCDESYATKAALEYHILNTHGANPILETALKEGSSNSDKNGITHVPLPKPSPPSPEITDLNQTQKSTSKDQTGKESKKPKKKKLNEILKFSKAKMLKEAQEKNRKRKVFPHLKEALPAKTNSINAKTVSPIPANIPLRRQSSRRRLTDGNRIDGKPSTNTPVPAVDATKVAPTICEDNQQSPQVKKVEV
jgi:hypothetical protein